MPRKHLSATARLALWQREAMNAYLAGCGYQPICNLCGLPVFEWDDWDESHAPVARAFACDAAVPPRAGVAHRRCNRMHGAQVVVPALAKSDRVRGFHIGARGPGLGKAPMRGGKRDRVSKTFRHGVVPRLSLAAKFARMRAKRAILTEQPEASP